MFPRNRWFGADGAIGYVGLLSAIHGVLQPLILAWSGRDQQPGAGQDDDDAGEAAMELGWDFDAEALSGRNHLQRLGPRAPQAAPPAQAAQPAQAASASSVLVGPMPEDNDEHAGELPEEAAAPDNAKSGSFDWREYHKQLKTSVADWVSEGGQGPTCATQLALMMQFMFPILRLLVSLLYISSKRWTREQYARSAKGLPRQFRLLVAHQCVEPRKLIKSAVTLMRRPPRAIPEADWCQGVSTLAFTMLSRLACSVHQLFVWRLQKYPYALMPAVNGGEEAVAIFNQKRCLQDQVTQELCKVFSSPASFSSRNCIELVQAIAILADTDIGAIERQHTIGRKIIQSRSLTTAVGLQTLSADWVLRQTSQANCDALSYLYFDSQSVVRKLQRKQKRNQKPKRPQKARRGGGGGFRAFLSSTTRGEKASGLSWKNSAKTWRAMTAEEKKPFEEMGALGTASHKRGYSSFGDRPKVQRKKKQQPALPSCVAGQAVRNSNAEILLSDISMQSQDLGSALAVPPQHHLQLLDPEQALTDKLALIRSAGERVRKQASDAREAELGAISSFLNNASLPSCLAGFPDPRPISAATEPPDHAPNAGTELARSYLLKPSPLPWLEWVPPADVFAQDRV